jgi:hypothetical protein
MVAINKTTPAMTEPIDHFIVRFKDGRVKKVVVGDGEGFYREELFVGQHKSFTTYQVYVAEGDVRDIPTPNADSKLQSRKE